MAVTNSGDPINTLRSALDAYTAAQETIVAAAAELKPPAPVAAPLTDGTREGGSANAVPAGS